jgi:membrane-associated protease RseP (regulator of RpoE activity)
VSDQPNNFDDVPVAPVDAPAAGEPAADGVDAAVSEPKKGFFSTTAGKIVAGCLAVTVLLVIAGVVVGLVLTFMGGAIFESVLDPIFGGQAAVSTAPTATPAPSKTATGTPKPGVKVTSKVATTAAGAEVTVTVVEVTNADVFEFRDPFVPLIGRVKESKASSSTTSTSGGGSGGTTTTTVDPNTLVLESISTVDGKRVGTFTWNGNTYVAGAGQRIDSSPWQVVSVSSDSAVVLFGDERITLTVGQGVSK